MLSLHRHNILFEEEQVSLLLWWRRPQFQLTAHQWVLIMKEPSERGCRFLTSALLLSTKMPECSPDPTRAFRHLGAVSKPSKRDAEENVKHEKQSPLPPYDQHPVWNTLLITCY
jgi:hypothetical protein